MGRHLVCALLGLDQALVLMPPEDEVEPVGDVGLEADGVPGVVLHLVLVDDQDVEPERAAVVRRAEPPDLLGLEGLLQALIADVAKTENCDSCCPLCEEERLYCDVVDSVLLPEIVQETAGTKEVECRILPVATWIIMVSMNDEYREGNVQIRILIIHADFVCKDNYSHGKKLEKMLRDVLRTNRLP